MTQLSGPGTLTHLNASAPPSFGSANLGSDKDRVSRATFFRPRMYVLVPDFESSGAERALEPAFVTRRPDRKGAPGPE